MHANYRLCAPKKCKDVLFPKQPHDVFEKVKLDRKRKKACKDSNNVADDVDTAAKFNRGKEISCKK